VRDLHKSFEARQVLNGISLDFPPDAITTILGPSGTGKSVLLKHIVGLLPPDEGEVVIHGRDLWRMSPKERRQMCATMGVLFQDGGMIGSLSVYDNVALPLRTHTEKSEAEISTIVEDRLGSVGLDDEGDKLPGEISGGMRKRAAFARALVHDPSIVVFDEPDSGLDPVRTNLLNELILEIHGRRRGTFVLVTHHIATALKVSDHIALIWRGQLVLFGTPEEILRSDDPFVRQFLAGETAGPLTMK
jgi:phospholipid/cholesterol/gamma-HCH transport system ATP-binding protein